MSIVLGTVKKRGEKAEDRQHSMVPKNGLYLCSTSPVVGDIRKDAEAHTAIDNFTGAGELLESGQGAERLRNKSLRLLQHWLHPSRPAPPPIFIVEA
jgi:hypothetical protein